MASKRTPTAAVQLRRPAEPITRSMLDAALAPLLQLLNADTEDVQQLTITQATIRLTISPRYRGRRQLDQALRVSYPIAWDDVEDA